MEPESVYPSYTLACHRPEGVETTYNVLTLDEASSVPELYREKFVKNGKVTVHDGLCQTHYLDAKNAKKTAI